MKNRIISVNIKENEEVEWIWTYLPNGKKYVSGYNIINKNENKK